MLASSDLMLACSVRRAPERRRCRGWGPCRWTARRF